MEKLSMVYVTASNEEEASNIGKKMVSMRLAACANVYGEVASFFWWEGKEDSAEEATLVLKTKESLLEELAEAVKKAHSYSCPCIVAVPIVFADEKFAEWIEAETK